MSAYRGKADSIQKTSLFSLLMNQTGPKWARNPALREGPWLDARQFAIQRPWLG